VDLSMPERFELTYVGADNREHRPVMVHRAVLGSVERFLGILIEHTGGDFPLWLAPVQAAVLPISEKFSEYAKCVLERLRSAGLRVVVDLRDDKIGAKIRDATLKKIPYMLIVGAREAESDTVSVRDRVLGDLGKTGIEEFIKNARQEVSQKKARPDPRAADQNN
ncbi:MAG: His/Gly/Thr/Pro-type tRNA ligase C-terminal domain-containing protein, partial [Planctomycetia bacterium]|nr:His/Gly/Thr/Pro-type tRNA ligase C-terminal domain-containing protein [Planctomycetia bacterium]